MLDRTRLLAALAAAACVVLTGCSGGSTSTSLSEQEAEYDRFLDVELSADADSAALTDEYGADPLAGPVRAGSGRLVVFLEPEATQEQIRELEARVAAEDGVQSVTLSSGQAPDTGLEVPSPSPS